MIFAFFPSLSLDSMFFFASCKIRQLGSPAFLRNHFFFSPTTPWQLKSRRHNTKSIQQSRYASIVIYGIVVAIAIAIVHFKAVALQTTPFVPSSLLSWSTRYTRTFFFFFITISTFISFSFDSRAFAAEFFASPIFHTALSCWPKPKMGPPKTNKYKWIKANSNRFNLCEWIRTSIQILASAFRTQRCERIYIDIHTLYGCSIVTSICKLNVFR